MPPLNLFQIFLWAATRTTALHQQEHQRAAPANGDKPSVLPVLINERLCTVEQDQWWNTAYQLFKNTAKYVYFVTIDDFQIITAHWGSLSQRHPHGQTTPPPPPPTTIHLIAATTAGSTHPTAMHSC